LFFHQRLKRRLAEEALIKDLQEAAGEELQHAAASAMVKEVYLTSQEARDWRDDTVFLAWANDPKELQESIQGLRAQRVAKQLVAFGTSAAEIKALPQGLKALLQSVDASTRVQLVEQIRQALDSSLANGS
jgi:acetyl-CoA carboxylase/biotin carboxylase 1